MFYFSGPMILTCRNHDKGCKKTYLHCPRQPNHILSSKYGDQLCSIVTKTREVKPVKESIFSNTYQTYMQQGSIYGIDTCDVTNVGKFDISSILLGTQTKWNSYLIFCFMLSHLFYLYR